MICSAAWDMKEIPEYLRHVSLSYVNKLFPVYTTDIARFTVILSHHLYHVF